MYATREQEAALFDRCLEIAQGRSESAENACEANAFFLASTLIDSDFPVASERLSRASATRALLPAASCRQGFFSRDDAAGMDCRVAALQGWFASLDGGFGSVG